MSSIKKEMRKLQPLDYTLNEYDVYCGRGNQCFNHIGNRKFRMIILEKLNQYSDSIRKYDKSLIIDSIVNQVRENCCYSNGLGFVKKDPATGRFYEVGNFIAREKTSQAFRDAINEKFNPNNKAKIHTTEKKQEENHNSHSDVSSKNCTAFHSIDDVWKNISSPSRKSCESLLDIFKVRNELTQQQPYPDNYVNKPLSYTDTSSIYETTHVTKNSVLDDEFNNIDVIASNEMISTRHFTTNSNDLTYDLGTVNSLSAFILNECFIDNSNDPSSLVGRSSSLSQTNTQAQFAKNNRIEELDNSIISDDEKTFNLLFQLTESFPDLDQCPFLQSTI